MSKETEVTFRFDGQTHSIDLADLSGTEMGTIKRHVNGVLGVNDCQRHFAAGDTQLMAVMCGLAMERSGLKPVDYQKLLDAPSAQFEIVDDDENPTQAETESSAPTGTPGSPESTE